MEYKISGITKNDLFDIERIGKASLPIYYKVSDLFFLLHDSSYIIYKICSLENNIIGFIVIKKYDRRYHIMSIVVVPDYRKMGIGTILIDKIKQLDNDEVSLYVLTNNESAIKFYKKNKFKYIKRLEDYYETLDIKSAFYYVFSNKSSIL